MIAKCSHDEHNANTKAVKLTSTTQIYQSSCTRSHNCMSSTSYVPYAHMYTHIYICFQTEFRLSVYIVLCHKICAKLAMGPVVVRRTATGKPAKPDGTA